MEEKLQYYTDICGLVNYKLMKSVDDGTRDDPKPKNRKEPKDLKSATKQKIKKADNDDIDEDAGPRAPKSKSSYYSRDDKKQKNQYSNSTKDKGQFKNKGSNRKFDRGNKSRDRKNQN